MSWVPLPHRSRVLAPPSSTLRTPEPGDWKEDPLKQPLPCPCSGPTGGAQVPNPPAWPARPSPSSRCRCAPSPHANAIWRDPGGRRAVWPSVPGGADGWSPDSNREMRTRWRRSRPRPRCSASPRVPPSAATGSRRCPHPTGLWGGLGTPGETRSGPFPALCPAQGTGFCWGFILGSTASVIQATHLLEPQFPLLYKGKYGP